MSTTMDKTQRTMMMILPVAFVPVIVNFPVGLVIYWVTTNLWTVGQGVVTRQLMPKATPPPKRSSRTPPKSEPESQRRRRGDRAEAEAGRLPAQPRRVKRKKKQARRVMEDLRQVEATGETVGEAKWAALRELEKLHPGLDKGAVRFQVVSEGERGLLGVGYAPARVVALVDAEVAQELDGRRQRACG